jgi:coproporphyrinogen III oxidase
MIASGMKDEFIDFIYRLQDEICFSLEVVDGKSKFKEEVWKREGGGGGRTRVISNGAVFEKGGVNTSVVNGVLPETMQKYFNTAHKDFFACGISLVIHPFSPMVPTVHANYRYFELYDNTGNVVDFWFGGGSDLSPSYIFPEDAAHFHKMHKAACDIYGTEFYPNFKKNCDDYFINTHRDNEARGIGGIFFDYRKPNEKQSAEELLEFSKSCGKAFIGSYLPIVEKRRNMPFTEKNKEWQGIRRSRYVEFNLLHDKGTLFGLRTNGRIESILMSLPPVANWIYDYQPEPDSAEAQTLEYLKPRDWADEILDIRHQISGVRFSQ